MNFKVKIIGILALTTTICFGYSKTDVPEGWASQGGGTTGGKGGTEVEVSTMSELSSAIKSSGKKIILVKPGTYNGSLSFSSNDKSVLGTAPGVLIKGTINVSAKNIIVRNIAVQDNGCSDFEKCRSGSDAVYIGGKGAENIWFDHVDVIDGMDGNFDVTKGPTNITVTWTKFRYTSSSKPHAFSNLIAGSDSESESKGRLNITYAYCWWAENVIERMPRGRFGKVHVLNNLYTSKRANYCCGPGHQMQMLIEQNAFMCGGKAIQTMGKEPFNYKSIGNIGTASDKDKSNGDAFTPPYTIKKYNASEVESVVRNGAGNTMTLGVTTEVASVKRNAVPQPHISISKSGWALQNSGSSALSFIVVTLQGKSITRTIRLDAGENIAMPSAASTLIVKFKGSNAPADMYVPFAL